MMQSPRQLLNAFYYDTLTHDDAALQFLSRAVEGGRLLYGSDYPFEMLDIEGPRRIERLAGANQEQVRAILTGNAEKALKTTKLVMRQSAAAS
ncbi:MAG: aminocarboxymuconate-semialdehyde decarboxylase [Alphaproteobacteria bacterium]|jgi:aminocarboxymuconate-semialdehyde decarboxylase|nr:aminocarboxymuconate-semialdehyde decarboxylase [Alphaproteobacteria bacterium]